MSDDNVLRIESDGTPEGDEALEDLRQFLIDALASEPFTLTPEERAELLRQLQGKPEQPAGGRQA